MLVVGVDGCVGGWLAMAWDPERQTLHSAIHRDLADVLAAYPEAAAIGIDIPIGLSETGTRQCDVDARKLLGHPRASSVFPAPVPAVLDAPTYTEASEWSRAVIGKGVSQQAFAIYAKIAEANRLVTPAMQDRVFELHPEVSFCALAGHPMWAPKRSQAGYAERRALLEAALGVTLWERRAAFAVARPAMPDDVLDATVAAWTAGRVARGEAERLPDVPELDAAGLRMEMVY